MEITKMKLSELKPADYNPRQISDFMLDKLKKSIKEFGIVEPIIFNKNTGHIVGGHMRYRAIKEMYGEDIIVDVVIVELDEAKEKALNIALNRIEGEWVEDKLIDVIRIIEEKEEEMLDVTGFSDTEIELLLARQKQYEQGMEDKFTIADIKETQVRYGDVFEIDSKHRIMCGDSTKPECFKMLMGLNKADFMVTSPPYNANIKYTEYSDNKEFNEYIELMDAVYKNVKDILNKDRFVCVNVGDMVKTNLAAHHGMLLEKNGFKYARTIYWVKPEGAARGVTRVPYPRWIRQKVNTETIMIYIDREMEDAPELFNVMFTYTDRDISMKDRPPKDTTTPVDPDLIKQYSTNVWRMSPETTLSKDHPAPYPTQLADNCIKFYSVENEIVLDPFLGSGTTVISAEKLKRKGYGMEMDPRYVEFAVRRYKLLHPDAKVKCITREDGPTW